jgi:digeranylgeranylglycerophospholipid reductase
MTLPASTDVLIVGAGPAGLSAAKQLQDAGVECLLIDAREKIGSPLRCAEAVPESYFQYFAFEPRPSWLRPVGKNHEIRLTSFDNDNTPSTQAVTHNNEKWLMLDRPRSEFEASQILAKNGMNVVSACALTGVSPFDGLGRTAEILYQGKIRNVKARIVIAADGQSSLTARLAGLHNGLSPSEVISYYAYWMADLKVDTSFSSMIFYPELAPFYFWFFPGSDSTANVGLGVNGLRGHASKGILDRIIANYDRCAGGRVVEKVIGWTPSTRPMSEPFGDGMLVVGTAAFYVGAISGEGILPASKSGFHAAKTIIELNGSSPTKEALKSYAGKIEELIKEHDEYWQHRSNVQKMTDDRR